VPEGDNVLLKKAIWLTVEKFAVCSIGRFHEVIAAQISNRRNFDGFLCRGLTMPFSLADMELRTESQSIKSILHFRQTGW
jgi:hypothetical protein